MASLEGQRQHGSDFRSYADVVFRLVFLVSAGLVWTGCGPPPDAQDAGLDAGAGRDGGSTRRDAGWDAGLDAGRPDSGIPDAGPRDAGPNHVPVVMPDILVNRTTVYAGQVADLALGVTDEDGDFLQFTWSGPGSFFENGNPSAQRWFSDERAAPGTATLTVSVTDGRSAPITRSVTLAVTVPRFSDVYSTILVVPPLQGGQCTGCHGTMGDYQVAPTRAGAYTQLVGAAHHRGPMCANAGLTALVVPSSPQQSLLYRKMSSTQPASCGDGMPAMSTQVPAAPRQFIVTLGSWIRAGAPND